MGLKDGMAAITGVLCPTSRPVTGGTLTTAMATGATATVMAASGRSGAIVPVAKLLKPSGFADGYRASAITMDLGSLLACVPPKLVGADGVTRAKDLSERVMSMIQTRVRAFGLTAAQSAALGGRKVYVVVMSDKREGVLDAKAGEWGKRKKATAATNERTLAKSTLEVLDARVMPEDVPDVIVDSTNFGSMWTMTVLQHSGVKARFMTYLHTFLADNLAIKLDCHLEYLTPQGCFRKTFVKVPSQVSGPPEFVATTEMDPPDLVDLQWGEADRGMFFALRRYIEATPQLGVTPDARLNIFNDSADTDAVLDMAMWLATDGFRVPLGALDIQQRTMVKAGDATTNARDAGKKTFVSEPTGATGTGTGDVGAEDGDDVGAEVGAVVGEGVADDDGDATEGTPLAGAGAGAGTGTGASTDASASTSTKQSLIVLDHIVAFKVMSTYFSEDHLVYPAVAQALNCVTLLAMAGCDFVERMPGIAGHTLFAAARRAFGIVGRLPFSVFTTVGGSRGDFVRLAVPDDGVISQMPACVSGIPKSELATVSANALKNVDIKLLWTTVKNAMLVTDMVTNHEVEPDGTLVHTVDPLAPRDRRAVSGIVSELAYIVNDDSQYGWLKVDGEMVRAVVAEKKPRAPRRPTASGSAGLIAEALDNAWDPLSPTSVTTVARPRAPAKPRAKPVGVGMAVPSPGMVEVARMASPVPTVARKRPRSLEEDLEAEAAAAARATAMWCKPGETPVLPFRASVPPREECDGHGTEQSRMPWDPVGALIPTPRVSPTRAPSVPRQSVPVDQEPWF
jgi:hypothetical protein